MPGPLSETQWRGLLAPFIPEAELARRPQLLPRLAAYLDLLLRWNSKVNLTSVREPEAIVTRHLGESLFAGLQLRPAGTLLDLGSGAGFPGLPIQLLYPDLTVTLAESQVRKAAFLREAVRVLDLATKVWPRRAEDLPRGSRFDTVVLRAVDRMEAAAALAATLSRGQLGILAGADAAPALAQIAAGFRFTQTPIPLSTSRVLLVGAHAGPPAAHTPGD